MPFGGGGIWLGKVNSASGHVFEIANSIFHDNTVTGAGGGIYIRGLDGHERIGNCTFYANNVLMTFDPTGGGAAIYVETNPGVDNSLVYNTIAWGNTGMINPSEIAGPGTELRDESVWAGSPKIQVQYSDVRYWPGQVYAGPGNINAAPLFVSPGTRRLQLKEGSPALDAGNDFLPLAPPWVQPARPPPQIELPF